nr:TlpA disulfide reductase family protein [uncultured Carboxylicivirga sp.]
MFKKIIFPFIFYFLNLFTSEAQYITITGQIDNAPNGTILFIRDLKSFQLIDSIEISNGLFSWECHNPEDPIILHNKRNEFSYKDRVILWVNSENIHVEGNFDYLKNLKIIGSNDSDNFLEVKKLFKQESKKLDSLHSISYQEKVDKEQELLLIKNEIANSLSKYSKSFLKNVFTIELLYEPQYFSYSTIRQSDILDIYTLLPDYLKDSLDSKNFYRYETLPYLNNSGTKAIEISMTDPNGRIVSLSDLKGKYVLLDFWASWCKPCRESFTDLKKIYAKYKDNGFEVYSVSGDDNKTKWINAINKDSIPWINVSDLQGMKNQAFIDYNVNGVPVNFLIDPGMIIGRDFYDFSLLANELHDIFEQKSENP